jgi:hypothetical protein
LSHTNQLTFTSTPLSINGSASSLQISFEIERLTRHVSEPTRVPERVSSGVALMTLEEISDENQTGATLSTITRSARKRIGTGHELS